MGATRGRMMAVASYREKEQAQSLIELGNAYLHAGHLVLAQEQYQAVLVLDSEHSTGLNNVGVVLYRLKKYKEAVVVFKRMLRLDKRDKRALDMMQRIPHQFKNVKHKEGASSSSSWGNLFGALS